jgi:hypothetical protein
LIEIFEIALSARSPLPRSEVSLRSRDYSIDTGRSAARGQGEALGGELIKFSGFVPSPAVLGRHVGVEKRQNPLPVSVSFV